MAFEGAPAGGAGWERGLEELTETIRQGLVHLGRVEAVLVRTGDRESVCGELNAALECDRRAQSRMDSLMAELRIPDEKRLVAQAVSKSTIRLLMQSFLLYRMTLSLIVRTESLGVRRHQCVQAVSLAKEFATSSMLLIRDAPRLEQRHLLKAVQDLNSLRRDFDDRFVPVFDRVAEMHGRLAPELSLPPISCT